MTDKNTSVRKKMNPALAWLWDMMSFYVSDEIKIPTTFREQVEQVKSVLSSDTSGIVNSVLDFAINSASVDYTIETDNENFTKIISEWFKRINISSLGRVPTGIKALAKENFRERWKNSSLILLRTVWDNIEINGTSLYMPVKMWFVDGSNIRITEGNSTRIIGEEKYYIRIDENEKHDKLLPSSKDEFIFVQKPFNSWTSLEPTPFIIQRGLYKNLKLFDLLSKKGEKFIAKALEYLLMLKKGSEKLIVDGGSEYNYSEEDLKKVKDDFKTLVNNNKSESGTPTYVTNFDTMLEHISPDYKLVMNSEIYGPIEKRILAGLGLIDIVEGTSASRRESILNPKPFIREVKTGISDFTSLLSDIMIMIREKNEVRHPKFFGEKIQFHYTPIEDFINDNLRDHLRSCYDRGVISKQTYAEVVGQTDFDIEVTRRKFEKSEKIDELMYPQVTQNLENKEDVVGFPPKNNDNIPSDKKGIEKKNYKGSEEENLTIEEIEFLNKLEISDEELEESVVIKKKDGWYVISEKTNKNLGGPYKTRKEAVKRLQQIEFWKHKGEETNE
jgi:hypothetical protein